MASVGHGRAKLALLLMVAGIACGGGGGSSQPGPRPDAAPDLIVDTRPDQPTLPPPDVAPEVPPDGMPAPDAPEDAADAQDGGDTGDVGDTGDLPPVGNDNGLACGNAGECRSGFCVDGVCCATACTGACLACDLAGQEGTCAPIAAGQDPDDECAPEPSLSCGRDGTCDGQGACRLMIAGAECTSGSCASASMAQPARTCDGGGLCRPAALVPCAANEFCVAGACVAKGAAGALCTTPGECASGFCVDGVCCDTACGGACEACNVAGAVGTCAAVPAGQDPANDCQAEPSLSCGRDGTCDGQRSCRRYQAGAICVPGSCANNTAVSPRTCDGNGVCDAATTTTTCTTYTCGATGCRTSCSEHGHCQDGFFCDNLGACAAKRPGGEACVAGAQCTSGFCADGVCCDKTCAGGCESCKLAGAVGTCTNVADGQDPDSECPAEEASTCGRAGGCNGAGACKLHAAGVACTAPSCSGATQTAPGTCNGSGTCQPGAMTACAPYVCGPSACHTSCTTAAECASTLTCSTGSCVVTAGLLLHWRLDETSGTTVVDSSGAAYTGTLIGTTGTAGASTSAAPTTFANPGSKSFVAANRHAIQLSPSPAALRPANNFSVSAWYRASSLDTSGGEVVSGGNQYVLRIKATQIEFSKRVDNGTGGGAFIACNASVTGHLDDNWHHVVGTTSAGGLKVYVDGVEKCTSAVANAVKDLRYDQNPDFWVGRHPTSGSYDFNGLIDDVRVYGRVLGPTDVAWLFQGKP